MTPSQDTAARAAEAIRLGSKSFAAAARLLEPAVRESAVLLYAWCRHCDDVIDGQELGFRTAAGEVGSPVERLAALEAQTLTALRGDPGLDPAFAALASVVRRHAIPDRYPLEHLAGFRMDVEGRAYRTIADTVDYAYHVAGVVGIMMAYVMGVRDPETLGRAADLGIGFQLTNIARDVIDDASAGRIYLPAEWLSEAGLGASEASILDPGSRQALAGVAARLVDAAEPYYRSSLIGIRALPARSAWAITTARAIYRAIGLEVVRRGPQAWDRRVSTSRAAKLRHALYGAVSAYRPRLRPPRSDLPPSAYARPR